MFQHAGRHIKHRPMCRPDSEGAASLPDKVRFHRPEGRMSERRGFNRKGNTMNKTLKRRVFRHTALYAAIL
ncbi:TPA: hypothetical protein ACLBFF_002167, partial [Neisseria meningitidis]